MAKITDKDGINAAGSGIGHDLQLVIDGDMSKTYVLNSNFISISNGLAIYSSAPHFRLSLRCSSPIRAESMMKGMAYSSHGWLT